MSIENEKVDDVSEKVANWHPEKTTKIVLGGEDKTKTPEISQDEIELNDNEKILEEEEIIGSIPKIESTETGEKNADNEGKQLSTELINAPETISEGIKHQIEIVKTLTEPTNRNLFAQASNEIGDDLKNKKYIEAYKKIAEFYKKQSNKLTLEQKDELEKLLKDKQYQKDIWSAEKEKFDELVNDKEKLAKIACVAGDFVPVAGPAKMLLEAAQGKTLIGEKLEGSARLVHAAEGAVFLFLDCTGGGIIASKIAKGTLTSGKLFTRTAAAMRIAGTSEKIYKPVFSTGRFIIKHPEIFRTLNRATAEIVKNRNISGRVSKEIFT